MRQIVFFSLDFLSDGLLSLLNDVCFTSMIKGNVFMVLVTYRIVLNIAFTVENRWPV